MAQLSIILAGYDLWVPLREYDGPKACSGFK